MLRSSFNIAQSDGYLGVDNFVNLFELSIEKIIVVIAMTFVIIAGEIDLSVASVMGFAACIVAALHERSGLPFVLILVIALAVSAGVGLFQGLVITKLELPSLVVTLAGLIALAGSGADSRRGPLRRRLSELVQLARPGRPARPVAVRGPALRRPLRGRRRHPAPQRVRSLRLCDR